VTASDEAGALGLPAVIGHRGAAAYAPENTIAGLRKAASLGTGWVEFDVRLSGDGVLVLLHDDRIDRTSDGRGDAATIPVAELKRRDFGAWFSSAFRGERLPTLEEAVAALGELGLGANVEIKPAPGAEEATGRAVGERLPALWPARLPPPIVSSFKPKSLASCRRAAPRLALGLLVKRVEPGWRKAAEELGCRTVHADHRHLDETRVREIREAGYPVLAYTVNDPTRARLLFGWGVDAVISDCPDRVAVAVADRSNSSATISK
jgi:glycerophosphoryl diester phosphodiesterase